MIVVAGFTSTATFIHQAHATPESVVYSFKGGTNGANPEASLINIGSSFYGTTFNGGASNSGTVFKVTASGVQKPLYSFKNSPDGAGPRAGLVNVNGVLYGTTAGGGAICNCGTVFAITTSGAETVIHSFGGTNDGIGPTGSLTNVNGVLYGTTSAGGTGGCNNGNPGCGTVFQVTMTGVENVVYSFQAGVDGAGPAAGLINVGGTLYGTTSGGGTSVSCGSSGCGTVFSVTPGGTENIVYSFLGGTADGEYPSGGLTYVKGVFYGTTTQGGATGNGTIFRLASGTGEAVAYSFKGSPDGSYPNAGLVQVGSTFYGTTTFGGSINSGTVFSVTPSGTEKVLHSFGAGTDGVYPWADLLDYKNMLYSTTLNGGTANTGSLFKIKP